MKADPSLSLVYVLAMGAFATLGLGTLKGEKKSRVSLKAVLTNPFSRKTALGFSFVYSMEQKIGPSWHVVSL